CSSPTRSSCNAPSRATTRSTRSPSDAPSMMNRRGFTLAELIVGMVILGVIGAALTRLFLSQSRFYDLEGQLRRARLVSRMAINTALSDLRMVEATGGLVSATPTQVTM